MATISVEQFVAASIQWATKRNDQLKYNWPVKGGWEGWIQVDLTAYILSVESSIEILREQPIFTSPYQRVDLLLNTSLQTDDQIVVEIKAESFENRMNPFINGIREDIRKLNEDRNTDFSECTCIMMALPFNQQSLDSVLEIEQDGHRIFRNLYTGEVALAFAVYTEQTGWIPASQAIGVEVPAHFPGNPFPSTAPSKASRETVEV